MDTRRILITGGTGFIGSAVARRLAGPDTQLVIPTRDAARARHLASLPGVDIVTADIHDPQALTRLAEGTHAAINLVGVLHSKSGDPWGPDFERAHVALPRSLAAACHHTGTARLIHISALGADRYGPSEYQRSKAAGEEAIHDGGTPPEWTILRPSVVFGPGDSFLNLFAQLLRFIPVLPLAGAHTRFQPVFVEDVAQVIAHCLDAPGSAGQTFELAGPTVYTLGELVRYVCSVTHRKRLIVPLPEPLAMLQGMAMEVLPKPPISRDNVRSLRRDNVAFGPPLPFGMTPTALEDVAPAYLKGTAR